MKILLTGSSTGIGYYLKEKLLSQKHEIWGLARSDQSPKPNFYPLNCDVAEWSQVSSAAHQINKTTNCLNAIICCAGIQGAIGPSMKSDPLDWKKTIEINLLGTFYSIRACWDLLQNNSQRSKVICFSGGGATSPRPNFSAYGTSKTAVVRLVETLANEWENLPIDINTIAPGAINTRLTEEVIAAGQQIVGLEEYNRAIKQKASDAGSMEKVFELVKFLLSEKSDGINGKLLSAVWDPYDKLHLFKNELMESDIYTLRRITPTDRGKNWS